MTSLAHKLEGIDLQRYFPWIALTIGVIAGTFAGPFIKLSQQGGLPSALVASGRMTLAAIILSPVVWRYYHDELQHLTRKDLVLAMFAGTLLQLHFQLFIFALESTSILIVTVLLNTGPLWVALIERIFLKERVNHYVWFGLIITISGGLFIALSAGFAGGDNDSTLMMGAILTALAAIAGAANLTVGRSVRRKVSLFPYVWIVFGFGGILGLVYGVFTGVPVFGHPSEGYFWLLMLTIIPQLLGHSGFNFALRYITATMTSLFGQLMTITAAVVAYIMFAEVPTMSDIIGSGIITVGVLIAIIYRSKGKSGRQVKS